MKQQRMCHRGRWQAGPCTCEMGNVYRFAEPVVLLALARLRQAHGYQIAIEAQKLAVTHAGLDSAGVYRTLRRLEQNGYVVSVWDAGPHGPARRLYTMTPAGRDHLREWGLVLDPLAKALQQLALSCQEAAERPQTVTAT
ncbi:MAG: PadR family transcriptional regulator [Armatimonadota bacterium]